MPGNFDANGVPMNDFVEIPDGEYILRIVSAEPGETKNGDPKVTVDYEITEGPYKLQPIKYHTVVFFKDKGQKGAGMALKFLKSIGEPYKGQFRWDEKNWIGKKLKGTVMQEVQTMGKNAGKKFSRIQWVNPCEEGSTDDNSVPF